MPAEKIFGSSIAMTVEECTAYLFQATLVQCPDVTASCRAATDQSDILCFACNMDQGPLSKPSGLQSPKTSSGSRTDIDHGLEMPSTMLLEDSSGFS